MGPARSGRFSTLKIIKANTNSQTAEKNTSEKLASNASTLNIEGEGITLLSLVNSKNVAILFAACTPSASSSVWSLRVSHAKKAAIMK